MTEKELDRLLAKKEPASLRKNVSVVLSPDITRNAMRLKKLRRDRMQAIACTLAALVFLIAAGGIMLYARTAENPESLLRPVQAIAAGGMALVLLLSPALAWFSGSEEERT